jgi:hypothetical protein
MKSKKLSKIAAGTLFALSFLGGKLPAQEVMSYPAIEQTEEIPSKIELGFDFESEKKQIPLNYTLEEYFEDSDFGSLSPIVSKIQSGEIDSYSSLLENAGSLTDNQKIVLLSLFADQLYLYDYTANSEKEVSSQEAFFQTLQDALNWKHGSIGLCRHISTNIEKLANDMGLRAAALTGSYFDAGHAYDIIKTENGTSIVDSYQIFSSSSKNIEKIIESYQKEIGAIMFQHLFFEDSKFKYELIPKDGKNFLDFTNYDPSLNELKNSLINKNKNPAITIEGTKNDNLLSVKLNLLGLYLNGGELSEDISPEKKIGLFQLGFGKKFILFNKLGITPDLSIVYGDSGDYTKPIWGWDGRITLSTENKEGLNLSSKFSHTIINMPKVTLYYKPVCLEAGVSYTLPIGKAKLEPYVLSQFAFLMDDFGVGEKSRKLKFNELEAGLKFSFPKDGTNITIDPHYINRIWEDEFGANLRLGIKNAGLNIEGFVTKSTYDFCPDKQSLSIGADALLGPVSLKLSYKTDKTNYDGEIGTTSSFSVGGKVKLK